MYVPGNTLVPTASSLEELYNKATTGTDQEKDEACHKLANTLDYNFDLRSPEGQIGSQCFGLLSRIIDNEIPHPWLSHPSYMAIANYMSRCIANK